MICTTEHEYTMQLPSKNNLASKHLIQHYCRCRDEQEKVFPFINCPDLKAMEVTVAPQSCSNQHNLNCPTIAPTTQCPTAPPYSTPTCNCPSPTPLPTYVPKEEPKCQTVTSPEPQTLATTAKPFNCSYQDCKSYISKECITTINSTIANLSAITNYSSAKLYAEVNSLKETMKLLWLTVVCVFCLLLIIAVMLVVVLLAISCKSEKPKKNQVDVVKDTTAKNLNIDDVMIMNEMYGQF